MSRDKVCALVPGGGYAEFCVAHGGCCLPIQVEMEFTSRAPGFNLLPSTSSPWKYSSEKARLTIIACSEFSVSETLKSLPASRGICMRENIYLFPSYSTAEGWRARLHLKRKSYSGLSPVADCLPVICAEAVFLLTRYCSSKFRPLISLVKDRFFH